MLKSSPPLLYQTNARDTFPWGKSWIFPKVKLAVVWNETRPPDWRSRQSFPAVEIEAFTVGENSGGFLKRPKDLLGGGFKKYFWFSPLFGEDFQFDSYFSSGLKPPTSLEWKPPPTCQTDQTEQLWFLGVEGACEPRARWGTSGRPGSRPDPEMKRMVGCFLLGIPHEMLVIL